MNPFCKFGITLQIERNNNYSAIETTKECGHPFGTVFAGNDDSITGGHMESLKLASKLTRRSRNLRVCPMQDSQTAPMSEGELVANPVEIN